MTALFLGVDAGNSKTAAVIATSDGDIIGEGLAGTGDIYGAGGEDGAVHQVLAAVRAAASSAAVDLRRVRASAFLLAGVDWPDDELFWRRTIASQLPELKRVAIQNDGFGLLRLGSGDGLGVSALAGTGGAVGARGPGGSFSLSFWNQHDLGAVGLGIAAIRVVALADLGITGTTTLTPALLAHFNTETVAALLESFTRRRNARSGWERATASRVVLREAADGDAAATEIVTAQTKHLAEYIAGGARRVGLTDDVGHSVTLGGALVTTGHTLYRISLETAVQRVLPGADIRVTGAHPVIGAVLEAMSQHDAYAGARDRLLSGGAT